MLNLRHIDIDYRKLEINTLVATPEMEIAGKFAPRQGCKEDASVISGSAKWSRCAINVRAHAIRCARDVKAYMLSDHAALFGYFIFLVCRFFTRQAKKRHTKEKSGERTP